ncbi:MAG: lamin tail domain-containing protein [Solirubrobacteraceae bacterium]|nr:lamin tail domain-containing protein [Solirubrobacteraceae bacterium]
MLRSLTAFSAAVCAALLAAVPAGAVVEQVPCLPDRPEPVCWSWTATVTHISDGDTLDVVFHDPVEPRSARVRINGIQAMELTRYSQRRELRQGECHAVEATARLEELVAASGGLVRLTAQNPDARSGARLRRSVAVLLDGRWVDVGRVLVSEGHALWLPNRGEWAWNETYNAASQAAAKAGANLWNPAYCGGAPPAALKLWVHWDADGNDNQRPDDEWVRIRNLDTQPVSLGGWVLRDSSLARFWFPADTVVPPGGTITVQVGRGNGSLLTWGLGGGIFNNVDPARGVGDGAYLFDPAGNLRAWMVYPCRVDCTDPNAGAFELRVQATGREMVAVRSLAEQPVDLDGYELSVGARAYAFGPGSVIEPGETLRVRFDGSPRDDTRLDRVWPLGPGALRNAGGAARLRTYDGIVLACRAWGSGSC